MLTLSDIFEHDNITTAIRTTLKCRGEKCYLPYVLEGKTRDYFEETFPGIVFVGKGGQHSHPILAIERRLCEELSFHYCQILNNACKATSIHDVGGSSNRHVLFNRRGVWVTNVGKTSDQPERIVHTYNCTHYSVDCVCRVFSACLFVHVLYYLSHEEIIKLLSRVELKVGLAVTHIFPSLFGDLGEGEYQRLNGDIIFTSPDMGGYRHGNLDWILAGGFSHGKWTVVVHKLFSMKFTHIYRLELVEGSKVYKVLDLRDSFKNTTFVGDVVYQNTHSNVNSVKFEITRIYSLFNWNFAYDGVCEYPIDKIFFTELTTYMSGRLRNHNTYAVLMAKAKQWLHKYNYPINLKAKILQGTVNAAFFMNIGNEFQMLNKALIDYRTDIERYNKALHFECTKSVWLWNVVNSVYDFGRLLMWSYRRPTSGTENVDPSVKSMDDGDYVLPQFKPIQYITHTLPLTDSNQVLLMDEVDDGVKIDVDQNIDIKPITGSIISLGIVSANHFPVAHASTQNNELISAVNRACLEKKRFNTRVFAQLRDWVDENFDQLFPDHLMYDFNSRVNYQEWNNRFPMAQRRKHDLAQDSLPLDMNKYSKLFKWKGFVKTEKLMLAGVGVLQDKDPRMIQGCHDQYNVIVGPHMYAISKMLTHIWNSQNRLYYSSGSTAEEIGLWFTPKQWYFENDFSRFDGSIHVDLLRWEIDLYRRLGLHRGIASVMHKNLNSITHTLKGVSFSVNGTRRSGTPNTSCGNSIINGLIHAYVLHLAGIHNYKMIVLGDDNLICFNGTPWTIHSNVFSELGLKSVNKFVPAGEEHNIEFCSSRFWPLLNNQWILGPKIGRMISKFGWFINPPRTDKERQIMLYGVAKSHYFDCMHIPVLRELLNKYMELIPASDGSVNNRPTHKHHATYLHTASGQIYQYVQQMYGVTEDSIKEIEALIFSVKKIPAVISHPILDMIIEKDLQLE